jgi:hypothetical protein
MKPILFSTDMVTAILEGRKSQTRRVIKPQPDDSGLHDDTNYPRSLQSDLRGYNGSTEDTGESREWNCPYEKGMILWVRETFRIINHSGTASKYWYKADACQTDLNDPDTKWKPSIFMPLEACRIFLEITGMKVERVQEISEGDAVAEGVTGVSGDWEHPPSSCFHELWEKINGTESWEANPWCWCLSFKQINKP